MKINSAILKARFIQSSFNLDYPINLELFCREIGIIVVDDRALDADGYLYKKDGNKYIFINSQIPYAEQKRFVLAHELGHYFLHTDRVLQICAGIIKGFDRDSVVHVSEREANDFAAEFLIPSDLIIEDLTQKTIDFDFIQMIAQKYGTSLTAAAIKCIEHSKSESEMLICYKDNCAIWNASPEHAPFFVRKNSKAPSNSVIEFAYRQNISNIDRTSPAGTWGSTCGSLRESIITVANGVKLLLLTEK